ncbi:hypothetical protein [Nocardioides ferulae]|uniref:hypothetical protein n=1 Tax=Nocardioides ferulae TaxID=2340821 RepID=UPI000F890C06|nr:hypothetical protein [Nocardioides ferulae]
MSSPAVQVRSRVPRLAGAAVERARLTVVPRARVQAPKVPFVILVSLVMLGGVIGLLLFNTSMQQASFAATALEGQATNLAARQQTLEMELERLRDPQRVAERAQRMGMVQPGAPLFLQLGDGEVLGEPTAAAGQLALQPVPPAMPEVLDPAPEVTIVQPPEGELPGDRDGRGDGAGEGTRNSSGDTGDNAASGTRGQGRNGSQEQSQQSQQSQDGPRSARR